MYNFKMSYSQGKILANIQVMNANQPPTETTLSESANVIISFKDLQSISYTTVLLLNSIQSSIHVLIYSTNIY